MKRLYGLGSLQFVSLSVGKIISKCNNDNGERGEGGKWENGWEMGNERLEMVEGWVGRLL